MCKLPCFALHCHHVVSRSTAALHTNKSPVFLFESGRKHQSELSDINKVSGMIWWTWSARPLSWLSGTVTQNSCILWTIVLFALYRWEDLYSKKSPRLRNEVFPLQQSSQVTQQWLLSTKVRHSRNLEGYPFQWLETETTTTTFKVQTVRWFIQNVEKDPSSLVPYMVNLNDNNYIISGWSKTVAHIKRGSCTEWSRQYGGLGLEVVQRRWNCKIPKRNNWEIPSNGKSSGW